MSHHVSAGPSNPTGAVEVVRVSNSASATAPVDNGTSTPVSTVSTSATPAAAPAPAGSGTPGANLPVDGIQQASNTIQNARADLTRTAGAERRLDGFDAVGGGGGGGGNNNVGQQNANNATGAVAQGTADLNTSDQNGGLSAMRADGQQILDPNSVQETESRVTEGA